MSRQQIKVVIIVSLVVLSGIAFVIWRYYAAIQVQEDIRDAYELLNEKLEKSARIIEEQRQDSLVKDTIEFNFDQIEPLELKEGDSVSLHSLINAYDSMQVSKLKK